MSSPTTPSNSMDDNHRPQTPPMTTALRPHDCPLCADVAAALVAMARRTRPTEAFWTLEDHAPEFPRLSASARQGCALCLFLARVLKERCYGPEQWERDKARDAATPLARYLGGVEWNKSHFSLDYVVPRKYEFALRWFREEDVAGRRFKLKLIGTWAVQDIRILQNDDFNPLSPNNIMRTRQAMRTCAQDHPVCSRANLKPKSCPKRLINLMDGENIRLEDTRYKRSPYAALSYCWGSSEAAKQARTVVANVVARMKRFSASELPATIRDAIFIARALGLGYLWVDSLCIVQGSGEFETEANRMMEYYGNAYVTIVPVLSTSADAGVCFSQTQSICTTFRDPRLDGTRHAGDAGMILAAERREGLHAWRQDVAEAEWSSRAWTMQERLNSTRVLFCFPDRFVLNCRHGAWETVGCWTGKTSAEPAELLPLDKDEVERYASRSQNGLWFDLVQEFTKRKLTVPEDRLAAFAGIAKRYEATFGCPIIHGMRRNVLLESLVSWYTSNRWAPATPLPEPFGSEPSWSWLGSHWHPKDGLETVYGTIVDQLLEPRARLLSVDPPRDGWPTSIALRSVFLERGELEALLSGYIEGDGFKSLNRLSGHFLAQVDNVIDNDDGSGDYTSTPKGLDKRLPWCRDTLRAASYGGRNITALLMGRVAESARTPKGDWLFRWAFLLVEPAGGPWPPCRNRYRRAGVLHVPEIYFDKLDPQISHRLNGWLGSDGQGGTLVFLV